MGQRDGEKDIWGREMGRKIDGAERWGERLMGQRDEEKD